MQERGGVSHGRLSRHPRPTRHADAEPIHQERWTNLPFETWWTARRKHDSGSGLASCNQETRILESWHARVSSRLQPTLGAVANIASSDSSADGTRIG